MYHNFRLVFEHNLVEGELHVQPKGKAEIPLIAGTKIRLVLGRDFVQLFEYLDLLNRL
jgi:hypothetical protein